MKTPAFTQLLLVVAFLLLPLLSVVMQRVMRRRLEEHTPERESVTPMPRRAPLNPGACANAACIAPASRWHRRRPSCPRRFPSVMIPGGRS